MGSYGPFSGWGLRGGRSALMNGGEISTKKNL